MRIVVATIVLSLALASAAFADAAPEGTATAPGPGALSTAQPQIPPAVKPAGTDVPSTTDKSPNAMPVTPIAPPTGTSTGVTPAPGFSEPNLKIPQNSGGKSGSYLIKDAPLPSDYVMGKISAPIIMIEYASLSCPHCAHFSNTVLPDLIKKYVDAGQMRYILRQFPLNEPALKGAMLLDCVGEQNKEKYFTFAKVLFDAQGKWAFDANYMSGLQTIAEVGGLSKEQFEHCVNNTDREVKVLKAKKLATDELQIPHTPFIFIDGDVYDGERTVEAMSDFIDKKLDQHQR